MSKNVLVVGAHPDDEILGAGGTLIRHARSGDKVFSCILSEGATARYGEDMIPVLREHVKKAGDIIGISDVVFHDFENIRMNAVPALEVVRAVELAILKFRPEIIYTHSSGDVNMDHRVVFDAVVAAMRLPERRRHDLPINMIKKVYCFETPSSTDWAPPLAGHAFMPNFFVDVKDTIDTKLEALKVYETETKRYPHPRSLEAIKMRANIRGIECGMEFAEAFMLIRELC